MPKIDIITNKVINSDKKAKIKPYMKFLFISIFGRDKSINNGIVLNTIGESKEVLISKLIGKIFVILILENNPINEKTYKIIFK